MTTPDSPTRRDFLQAATVTAIASTIAPAVAQTTSPAPAAPGQVPWYRRAFRWGQTNITEADIARYDIPWWRQHWKRTQLHGIIVNAGGIFAYYPSKFPLHFRATGLGERDLFGELTKAAHDDGLFVFARMDSSKAHEPLYRAHPDWFAVDAAGNPYRSGEFYLSCISSPYYDQWIPDIMREIIERSHPDGFTDNIWNGIERNQICYCQHCVRRFREFANLPLPVRHDWNDQAFRRWIEWSYARRIELWEFNNKVTREAGGRDCIWAGMNGGNISGQSASFRDLKEICARADIIMLDNQSRSDSFGLQENAFAGKLIHSLLGWDKLIPESMAMYQHGRPQFRLTTKSPPEARMWMLSGFAGGIQPWWHHVGAYHEDRRMFKTAEPVMRWHRANEQYLFNRRPIASVAIGWSHRNTDFFGRDSADELVDQPFRGWVQALLRARIPFLPLHLDYLDRDAANFSTLILPNIGTLTDAQIAAIRRFVQRGGALIATGQTSLHDQWGDARPDFALADLFGVKGGRPVAPRGGRGPGGGGGAGTQHTYLRLTPELRARVDGPHSAEEPPIPTGAARHPILAGFDETDILEYGGTLQPLTVDPAARVPATFIPSFPATPPEIVYMRTPRTDIPAIVVSESQPGRIVYFAADLDRRFALENFPDHGDVLANAVHWAARDSISLAVDGPGLINCELYQQDNRLILHLVNLTSAATWRAPVHQLIPVGPLTVRIRPPAGLAPRTCSALVTAGPLPIAADPPWLRVEVKSVLDHEVLVLEA